MIAIVDYGVGNLFSLRSSLAFIGVESKVTNCPDDFGMADKIILPGVGAFGDAMQKLRQSGLISVLQAQVEQGKPLLGICLGMQLLFEHSREFGSNQGLGFIKGEIHALDGALEAAGFSYKVPHMGWNPLNILNNRSPLMKYTRPGESFYYVHSFYAAECDESIVATSEYGIAVPGVVQCKNIYGTQFHPEKSGKCGLAMLKAFAEVS
ncbi:imidazole glycerol phosphate synthase subunit HisH [Ruminococcaceae bacterium OttesenSCG-928-D13]|nr:imidazole glycerol phosphate synthase subunit HisH [Ruminococcaceae bacterium OttesenSCG-928-D13]